ncbi:MAG: HAMP domain-containing protein [Elusimicrobia bacterium]|nr:HAMP domain-containing protein [Candidatus Liberimonas magnetica]
MRLKLFPKFFIILVILAVVPAAIVGWRTVNINKEGMQAAILELHTNMAISLADSVNEYLKNLDREIQYVIQTLSSQMTWNDRQSVLQALLNTNENLVSVSIVEKKGSEFLKAYNASLEKNPRLLSMKQDQTFISFWKSPKLSSLSEVYFVNDEPRINIVYPLDFQYCLYVTVTLDNLWKKITHTRIASTGYAFLVNSKGEIIAHPQVNLAKTKTPVKDLPIVNEALKAVSVGSKEYTRLSDSKGVVGAYAPIEGLKWAVIIQQDKDEAYISVKRMQKQAVFLILISLVIASALVFFIARDFTKPLVSLTKAAQFIAEKNFNVHVSVHTRDELQDLAETFNNMTMELRRYDEMQVDKVITEKTKTESVVHSISDGLLLIDQEGRLQLVNRKAEELLGLPAGENWQNKAVWNLVKNPLIKDVLFEVVNMAKRKEPKQVSLSSDALTKCYEISAEDVVTREKNEKLGVLILIRDITLEKELEKMKDDFLHSITHDLRNPVTSIRGFLKFLIDGVGGEVNEKQKKMLDTMNRATQRLIGLIDDILDIAKLEAGRMHLNLEKTDIYSVAQKMIEFLEPHAVRKSIKLSVNAPEGLEPVLADSRLLERVFGNLIGNALKFTPDNGQITVNITDEKDHILVVVTDTGEGIPPEYTSKIFDKFQQVAGQRRGGTGLGLTICKHIVEAHNGTIWAESKIGEGSKFCFTISKTLKPEENQETTETLNA